MDTVGDDFSTWHERFDAKCEEDPETGCWVWKSSLTRGYGTFSMGGRPCYAHRVSYERHRGPIPPGAVVMHACDNPACVNPAHLSVGSVKDNMEDAVRKGRTNRGARRWNAKLDPRTVRLIRLLAARGESQRALARHFGVDQSTVHLVVARKKWVHIG